jgi:hypothetical protein
MSLRHMSGSSSSGDVWIGVGRGVDGPGMTG